MKIKIITGHLVAPGKNFKQPPEVKSTILRLEGKLFNMLSEIFEKSNNDCDIPIRFVMAPDGSQNNIARSLFISYLENPDLPKGVEISNRLCSFSTNTSGLGLLFLILGEDEGIKKLLLSRFPAENGILAETAGQGLQVDYIERVFMKSILKYKAALYQDDSISGGFWSGHAIDKQLNTSNKEIADYWIHDFLLSDFLTTSVAGTKRFAIAIRDASRQAETNDLKQEIVSLGILTSGLKGNSTTIQEIFENFQISNEARTAITANLGYEGLLRDRFVFDQDEYKRHAAFASIELDNEGILMAPAERFNSCFQKEIIDNHRVRITTEGHIVDERIRGRK